MQLISEKPASGKLEQCSLLERIKRENDFISGILNCLQGVQLYTGGDESSDNDETAAEDDDGDESGDNDETEAEDDECDVPHAKPAESRVHTIEELQERLRNLKAKRSPKVTLKDRMLKKGYQDRLKKKKKKLLRRKEQRKEKMNLVKQQNPISAKTGSDEKKPKPVFNSKGKMVFSKFDFSTSGEAKSHKGPKDAKKILEKLKSREEKLAKIAESGNVEKLIDIKKHDAWQNALKKSEGIKVKDDPELLKKSIKRKEAQKKRSAQKWATREKETKRMMEDRQKKRQANIEAKKEQKKKVKRQQLIKKGRIIPGF